MARSFENGKILEVSKFDTFTTVQDQQLQFVSLNWSQQTAHVSYDAQHMSCVYHVSLMPYLDAASAMLGYNPVNERILVVRLAASPFPL